MSPKLTWERTMRYGVCNWVFGDEDLASTAAFLVEAGFDGIELMGNLGLYQPARVNTVLNDYALSVLSLTPEDVDLAHPDPGIRADALDYYLRLLDFAAEVGAPMICCHGEVGRVRALASFDEEYRHLLACVQLIAARAVEMKLCLAMEVLNRYESHLLNTAAQALQFVNAVAASNVGILLDTYHMNIEEADPALAIQDAGNSLFLFHVADSNREAAGRGHTDFVSLMRALSRAGYEGDLVIECTAAGPDPFTPVKGPGWRDQARRYALESKRFLKVCASVSGMQEEPDTSSTSAR